MQKAPWQSSDGVYIIAEIGGNHEGNFDYACELTHLACQSGADNVKFQVYTGDSLVNKLESPDRHSHFKKFQLTHEQYLTLHSICKSYSKDFSASVWDVAAIDSMAPLMPFFKIGSGDLTAYPVLAALAKTKKPLMLSTGLSTLEEIQDTVNFLTSCDPIYEEGTHLSILQCTSMYPIPDEDANLNVILTLQEKFPQYSIGYSDHTTEQMAVEVAVSLGAEILEVHFTDKREGKTFRDHKVSLVKDEIQQLRSRLVKIKKLAGSFNKAPAPSEIESNHITTFRRGLYLNKDLKSGSLVKESDLVSLRPNHGIDARDWQKIIGKKTTKDLQALAKLSIHDFK